MRLRLGGRNEPELGRVGPAEVGEAGGEVAPGELIGARRAVSGLLQVPHALVVGVALHGAEEVLEQDRDAAERAVGQGARRSLLTCAVEELVYHRVELRVELLDALYGSVDELYGRGFTCADQVGLRGGVE